MNRCKSLLICALAMFSASAESSRTLPLQPYTSFAVDSAAASGPDFSAQTAMSAGRLRAPWAAEANFADFGGDMIRDIRATSAGTPNGWLIALAAFGLVVLQLRRKHKSLPQRRIFPCG